MARKPAYPLESLLKHRERGVDSAKAALVRAVHEAAARERTKAEAERARARAEELARDVREQEAAKMMRGELRAQDLAFAAQWENSRQAESRALDASLKQATVALQVAHADALAAKTHLGVRKAEESVVARDKANAVERAQRASDETEQEEAEDLSRGRR